MPSKNYWLQLLESSIVPGLLALYPYLTTGQLNYILLSVAFVCAVAHSLAKHAKNAANWDNLIDAIKKLLPSDWQSTGTIQTQAVRPPSGGGSYE